ncbi:MAG: SGNH/GDSL hydrolase family protein [Beijerinckiaceae bacterium]
MNMLRYLKQICIAGLLLLTAGPVVDAQESDALNFFRQNPSSTRPLFRNDQNIRRVAPAPQPRVVRPRAREDNYVQPRRFIAPRAEPDVAVLPQPDKPVVPVTTFVHVLGDSLAELLAQGLKEQLVDKGEIGVLRKTRSSSGIVRDDYYDWNKALRELFAGTEKVDLLVMMIGSNDRQPLRDETGSHEFRSDRWREIYVKRLDDLLGIVQEKRLPMIWVGQPIMQSQRLSIDMLFLNDILRERVVRGGFTYVDVWEGFASDQGQYSAIGPDVNGEIVRLRTADGIHFTKAGQKKLGFFAAKDIDRLLSRSPGSGTAIAALPSDLSEQIRRDAPGLAPSNLQSALPLPETLPTVPVIRERPLIGPVFVLTDPAVTSGGALIATRLVPPSTEMTILVEQALGYGRQTQPKPGRADDFTVR